MCCSARCPCSACRATRPRGSTNCSPTGRRPGSEHLLTPQLGRRIQDRSLEKSGATAGTRVGRLSNRSGDRWAGWRPEPARRALPHALPGWPRPDGCSARSSGRPSGPASHARRAVASRASGARCLPRGLHLTLTLSSRTQPRQGHRSRSATTAPDPPPTLVPLTYAQHSPTRVQPSKDRA